MWYFILALSIASVIGSALYWAGFSHGRKHEKVKVQQKTIKVKSNQQRASANSPRSLSALIDKLYKGERF